MASSDSHAATRRRPSSVKPTALALALALLASCGEDTGTEPRQPDPPVPTSLALSASDVSLTSLGETHQLTATVLDQRADTMSGQAVTWSSSNDAVVSVSNGVVMAVANGSETVTASSGTLSATASVSVDQVVASVTLNADAVRLGSVGDTVTLVATVADALGSTVQQAPLTWASSDTLVATVDSAGRVTAVASGRATVSAASGSAAAEASVTSVPFYRAENGVTVICSIAEVGDTATIDGVRYTKRNRDGIDALVSAVDYPPLASTCTSGVTTLEGLFVDAATFNEDLSTWDVSSVTSMSDLFNNAAAFDQPIGDWDVSGVVNMRRVFADATSFNQPIGDWDVSSVRTMQSLFARAEAFNQPIGGWDVSSVADMALMFYRAFAFNQPIGGWDVGSVLYMQGTFQETTAFDQPIGGWDVSSVLTMYQTFFRATAFNADLSGWCVEQIVDVVPVNFDVDATSWTLPRPVWGTCSPASLHQSTLSASATSLPADGSSTVTLTVQLKDVDGVNLGENSRALTFDAPSLGSVGAVTENGDGTYNASYSAGTTPGTVTITGRLDGVAMTQTVDITLN